MAEHIWIVRDPSGTVIGAGTRPVSAVCEMERAEQHNPAFLTLFGALERSYPDWVVRYEANGYTLTREPLPAPVAASEPVAWACYVDGDLWDIENDKSSAESFLENGDGSAVRSIRPLVFGDVAHPSATAGAEVVELDEWWVVGTNGYTEKGFTAAQDAATFAAGWDSGSPAEAPHRVMRVCLKEVDV